MYPSTEEVGDLTKWDGEILRNGKKGLSGTHQSIVLMSEDLVRMKHSVWVACGSCNEGTINGVEYIDYSKLGKIAKYIDVLVITPWTPPTILNEKWISLSKIVLWCHLKELYIVDGMIPEFRNKYRRCKIYCNFITDFVRTHYMIHKQWMLPYFKERTATIRNPILLDMAHHVTEKDPRSFIFHASFERGGALACRAFDGLTFPDKKMTLCSYVVTDTTYSDLYTIGSKNKKDLFECLARTEYFVYPGVCSTTFKLTKETDSCVVAEALLHEVIVLAFPVGALYENYGNHVVWIPFPSGSNVSSIQSYEDSTEPELISEEVIKSIQSIIYELDANPTKKSELRKRGKEHVLQQRNLEMITSQFLALLDT
jgi:hypothetical protein